MNELQIKKSAEKVNKQFVAIKNTHKSLVTQCIKLGNDLTEIKAKLGHGNWEDFFSNRNSELRFGRAQAQKIMQISDNKELSLVFLQDENAPSSINEITARISKATDEEKAAAEKIKQNAIEEAEKKEQERIVKAEEKAKEEKKQSEPEIIEGEFTEVEKEEPKKEELKAGMVQIEEHELENIIEQNNEIMSVNESLVKDIDSIGRVFESDDQLSTATKEIKRLNQLTIMLQGRVNSLTNSGAEKERLIKKWESLYKKEVKKNKGK